MPGRHGAWEPWSRWRRARRSGVSSVAARDIKIWVVNSHGSKFGKDWCYLHTFDHSVDQVGFICIVPVAQCEPVMKSRSPVWCVVFSKNDMEEFQCSNNLCLVRLCPAIAALFMVVQQPKPDGSYPEFPLQKTERVTAGQDIDWIVKQLEQLRADRDDTMIESYERSGWQYDFSVGSIDQFSQSSAWPAGRKGSSNGMSSRIERQVRRKCRNHAIGDRGDQGHSQEFWIR